MVLFISYHGTIVANNVLSVITLVMALVWYHSVSYTYVCVACGSGHRLYSVSVRPPPYVCMYPVLWWASHDEAFVPLLRH